MGVGAMRTSRYATNPEYQERTRTAARERYHKYKNDPLFAALRRTQRTMSRLKQTQETYNNRLELLAARLLALVDLERKLSAQWKRRQHGNDGKTKKQKQAPIGRVAAARSTRTDAGIHAGAGGSPMVPVAAPQPNGSHDAAKHEASGGCC